MRLERRFLAKIAWGHVHCNQCEVGVRQILVAGLSQGRYLGVSTVARKSYVDSGLFVVMQFTRRLMWQTEKTSRWVYIVRLKFLT